MSYKSILQLSKMSYEEKAESLINSIFNLPYDSEHFNKTTPIEAIARYYANNMIATAISPLKLDDYLHSKIATQPNIIDKFYTDIYNILEELIKNKIVYQQETKNNNFRLACST